MDYTTLGRTGMRVSIAGLGCGGHSRLGQATGKTEQESIAVVRQALDLGINMIDTAELYGTESIVGKALQGVPRDQVIVSTKKLPPSSDLVDPAGELRKGLEESLRRLRMDYVDVYFLHGLRAHQYRFACDVLVPEMQRMREEGKLRAVGVTEAFISDPPHLMLQQAVTADFWEVMMVGFSLLNPSARMRVFPFTQQKQIGVLGMFAVRRALSQPAALQEVIVSLQASGQLAPDACDKNNPLGFLTADDKAATVPEAAYRFCRYEPGMHTVLIGTGNVDHLKENVASILKPPLAAADVQRLDQLFGKVDSVSGE
jgi:aryl-alcohol dehydrogenase-like predicted oxidoreductase